MCIFQELGFDAWHILESIHLWWVKCTDRTLRTLQARMVAYPFYDDCFQAGGLVQGGHLINIYVAKEENPSLSSANPDFQVQFGPICCL